MRGPPLSMLPQEVRDHPRIRRTGRSALHRGARVRRGGRACSRDSRHRQRTDQKKKCIPLKKPTMTRSPRKKSRTSKCSKRRTYRGRHVGGKTGGANRFVSRSANNRGKWHTTRRRSRTYRAGSEMPFETQAHSLLADPFLKKKTRTKVKEILQKAREHKMTMDAAEAALSAIEGKARANHASLLKKETASLSKHPVLNDDEKTAVDGIHRQALTGEVPMHTARAALWAIKNQAEKSVAREMVEQDLAALRPEQADAEDFSVVQDLNDAELAKFFAKADAHQTSSRSNLRGIFR